MNTIKDFLKFPVPVSLLKDLLPHRPPLLWIDEVVWVGERQGECRLSLQKEAHYFDKQGVRISSLVEWMAQGYGFVRACQILMQRPDKPLPILKKTYLAAISDIDFTHNARELLNTGKEVFIHVQTIREAGPLTLVSATVKQNKSLLARGDLKVYSA